MDKGRSRAWDILMITLLLGSIALVFWYEALDAVRDAELRDLHFDVGYAWQTAYMSPNEGGSGASTPMFLDFCKVLLGWHAVRNMASAASVVQQLASSHGQSGEYSGSGAPMAAARAVRGLAVKQILTCRSVSKTLRQGLVSGL